MDNPYNVRVITSTNLVAQFTLKKYTVTFLDWDWTTTNDTRVVEHGSAADAPPPIEHPGYAFTGWSADINSVTSISGLGRVPGEGNGNSLQYSGLENSTDRGDWQVTVHRLCSCPVVLGELDSFE